MCTIVFDQRQLLLHLKVEVFADVAKCWTANLKIITPCRGHTTTIIHQLKPIYGSKRKCVRYRYTLQFRETIYSSMLPGHPGSWGG